MKPDRRSAKTEKYFIHVKNLRHVKLWGNGLDNDVTVTGRLSGRMKIHRIKVMVGDQVHVGVSPYDPSDGVITYRLK